MLSLIAESRGYSSLWCSGLVALQHVKSSWTRNQTHAPCIIHCTTREVPQWHSGLQVLCDSQQVKELSPKCPKALTMCVNSSPMHLE